MRLSVSTRTNLVCLSLLTEPLPSFVGWDCSAGGAGDGAGENSFFMKPTYSASRSTLYSFQHFTWINLVWMSNTMLADGLLSFWEPTIFMLAGKIKIELVSYGIVAHCLALLFVLTIQGSKLMWKDMLIIIHLHPGAVRHQSPLLFPAPTAGLPAGAAGLTDREVTTRGHCRVIVSPTYTHVKRKKRRRRRKGAFVKGRGSVY